MGAARIVIVKLIEWLLRVGLGLSKAAPIWQRVAVD